MHTFKAAIIIPCYNEASNLAQTCYSLGFGISKETCPLDTFLVLVNNSSTDNTDQVCREIKDNSPIEKVIICNEPIRGFIPARTVGITAVQKYLETKHTPASDIFIVQFD